MAWTKTLLATGLIIFLTPAAAITPSPGCTSTATSPPTPGTITNHTLTINSKPRWYLLNIPSTSSPTPVSSRPLPHRLIFTLHAMGGNSTMVANGEGGYLPWYGLPPYTAAPDPTGAIYIAPNGLDRGWANKDGEDVAFITAIAADVKKSLCVDEDLVFSVGFSYGASMSYALACSQDTRPGGLRFRAVAVQSGGNMSGCVAGETLKEPVALYGQHGVNGDLNLTRAREIRDKFVVVNGCKKRGEGEDGGDVLGTGGHKKTVYEGCKAGYPVTWIEYDGGHTPRPTDKGTSGTWSAEEVWGFFGVFK